MENSPVGNLSLSREFLDCRSLAVEFTKICCIHMEIHMLRFRCLLHGWIGLGLLVLLPAIARSQDTSLDLMLQSNRLRAWLAVSDQAEGWRRFLLLNQLETQATRGWQADPVTLANILDRFNSPQPGLEHPYFATTAQALAAHLAQLKLPVSAGDAALANAAAAYSPVDQARLEQEIASLQQEIGYAQTYYAQHPSAPDSPQASLKLDALAQLLARLDLNPSVAADSQKVDGLPTIETSSRPGRSSSIAADKQADLRELQTHLVAFGAIAPALSDRFFPILHRQLSRVTFQYGQFADNNAQAVFERRLRDLQTSYDKVKSTGDQHAQAELALTLGWFDVTGQSPELVRALRRELAQPNVRFSVGGKFIQAVAQRPATNQQRPVDEIILGRRILGTACVSNQVHIDLIDDPNQAHISIHLRGTIHSDNYTRQGPVTAFSKSDAPIEGRRSILGNVGGITEYAPYVAAKVDSTFAGVDCIPLVEKIAYKQYLKDKYASEAIAARRTENRVIDEFAQQTDEAIQQGKLRMRQSFQENQSRLGKVGALCVHTSSDRLHGFGVQSDTFQLAAITPPSDVSAEQDVVVQIHESALDNFIEPYLARQTIRNTEIAGKIEQLTGRPPENFADQSGENWSITFPPTRPVQVAFQDNRISVTLVGNRFTRDDRPVNEPMAIRIPLKIVNDQGTLRFVRDGKITVDFVSEDVPAVSVTAFRSFLEDVLNKSVQDQTQKPAAGDPSSELRLSENLLPLDRFEDRRIPQDLKLTVFRAEQGWLTAAWQYLPGLADAVRSGYQFPVTAVDTPLISTPE